MEFVGTSILPKLENSKLENSKLENSKLENSKLENSKLENLKLENSKPLKLKALFGTPSTVQQYYAI